MNCFAFLSPRSWILVLVLLGGCSGPSPGLGPEEALRTFEIAEGFEIELFAAEPLVMDPVAMEVDELGRIWVVEMSGYPLDLARTGRIKLLEDNDGDGKPETSTLFADQLRMPTGILRWKNGVLVIDAPDVLYFEDSDNDGQADIREIVLTGFAFSNPQHLVSTPLYGLDNWIYLAHEPAVTAVIFKDRFGDRGSRIFFPGHPDAPVLNTNADGRNVRFRPDTYELEMLSGTSQYGHTFDEWGRHFVLNNSNHVRQEVVAARYLQRNPSLLVRSALQDLSDHGNAAQVFPITKNPEHAMLTDVGQLTSACGLTLYLGGAFPPGFERTSFVAEPVHNLVHADHSSDTGPTFVARRWPENREFLASTDSWFRPVNFYIGPDGALYLLDYYRRSIEHPEWMDDHYHGPGRGPQVLYDGGDRGRIYRIVPKGSLKYAVDIDLSEASDQEFVSYLESPNIWWRRTAQRLLIDRGSESAVEPLIRLFQQSRSPVARVHALWTLDGLGLLEESLIETALQDESPGVRENAIRLAEPRLSSSALRSALLSMNSESDPKVRFQLLCTLGSIDSKEAEILRNELLWQDLESDWVQIAALTAASLDVGRLLSDAVTRGYTAGF
ncbi:MAG TPA: PVC-type heme-binding CxxCH protein [Acidobacteriota bacterium]|nr:PVC-type heme-binding CxxCH protein [Acidobacteriota bacterium]